MQLPTLSVLMLEIVVGPGFLFADARQVAGGIAGVVRPDSVGIRHTMADLVPNLAKVTPSTIAWHSASTCCPLVTFRPLLSVYSGMI